MSVNLVLLVFKVKKKIYIWVEPARKGKCQKIAYFTLYVLGSLDHLYIFSFAGNWHVFEAVRGESYYGI